MLNTARIAKNTIFLCLRMILVLAANFLVTPANLLVMLFVGCTSSKRTFLRQKLAAKLHRAVK